jgi:hypothetical protein
MQCRKEHIHIYIHTYGPAFLVALISLLDQQTQAGPLVRISRASRIFGVMVAERPGGWMNPDLGE